MVEHALLAESVWKYINIWINFFFRAKSPSCGSGTTFCLKWASARHPAGTCYGFWFLVWWAPPGRLHQWVALPRCGWRRKFLSMIFLKLVLRNNLSQESNERLELNPGQNRVQGNHNLIFVVCWCLANGHRGYNWKIQENIIYSLIVFWEFWSDFNHIF